MEAAEEREKQFGTGKVGGGRTWEPPVHAVTEEGKDITTSFGKGTKEGQTLASSGHTGMAEFYDDRSDGRKGHDHYGSDGDPGKEGDRGRW